MALVNAVRILMLQHLRTRLTICMDADPLANRCGYGLHRWGVTPIESVADFQERMHSCACPGMC